jgi:hypothetical protein
MSVRFAYCSVYSIIVLEKGHSSAIHSHNKLETFMIVTRSKKPTIHLFYFFLENPAPSLNGFLRFVDDSILQLICRATFCLYQVIFHLGYVDVAKEHQRLADHRRCSVDVMNRSNEVEELYGTEKTTLNKH